MSVLQLLREGLGPSEIWKKGLIPERTVKRALGELKATGVIKNVGYGTWEIVDKANDKERTGQLIHRVAHYTPTQNGPKNGPILKPDDVRGHGIQATVKVPKFLNWPEREDVLLIRKIPYETIPQGQRIKVGYIEKVWLCRRSVVIYFPKGASWWGETAKQVAAAIMQETLKTIMRLERMLGASFKIGGHYWIKFSRQHDSLIKNGLAQMYNKPRQKIYFRDERGTWGLIDNSYNLEELETVRGERVFMPIDPFKPLEPQVRDDDAARDHNTKVKAFMNGVKDTGITPQFVLERFADTAKQIQQAHGQIAMYAKNLETHVGAVNNLSNQAQENAKTTASLREAVSRLAATFKGLAMPPDLTARLPEEAVKRLEKRASEPRRETKTCGLCGGKAAIPVNRDICDACLEIVQEHKRPTRESTIREYVIS